MLPIDWLAYKDCLKAVLEVNDSISLAVLGDRLIRLENKAPILAELFQCLHKAQLEVKKLQLRKPDPEWVEEYLIAAGALHRTQGAIAAIMAACENVEEPEADALKVRIAAIVEILENAVEDRALAFPKPKLLTSGKLIGLLKGWNKPPKRKRRKKSGDTKPSGVHGKRRKRSKKKVSKL